MGSVRQFLVAGLMLALSMPAARVFAQAAPGVEVRDQFLAGNTVIVDMVSADEPGWVDIHAEAEVAGNPGGVIGYAAVKPGQNNYVLVPVDGGRVTPVLYAVLHADRGQAGVFEFPGADAPIQVDGKAVTAVLHVLDQPTRPSSGEPGLSVRDQAVVGGQVLVSGVVAAQPGWVDIHAEAEVPGNPGAVIGYSPIEAGETSYVRVPITLTSAMSGSSAEMPVLYAVLHLDAGQPGVFEFPGADIPVQVGGQTVVESFRVLPSEESAPVAAASPASAAVSQVMASPSPAVTATPTSLPTSTPTSPPTISPAATATTVPATAGPQATPAVAGAASAAVAQVTASPSPTATTAATALPTGAAPSSPAASSTAVVTAEPAGATSSPATATGAQAIQATPGPATLPATGGQPPAETMLVVGVLFILLGFGLWSRRGPSRAR